MSCAQPLEGASKALRSLSEGGFAHYDDAADEVWVPEMAAYASPGGGVGGRSGGRPRGIAARSGGAQPGPCNPLLPLGTADLVGTIFEDSPLGLDKWFTAVWGVANANGGVASTELGRVLGVRQGTAWAILLRIKLALSVADRYNKRTRTRVVTS